MKNVISFLMKQNLLINLIVVLILSVGFVTIKNINREVAPEVNFDMVTITTIYPGASPDECEQLITIPIEKKLREVMGLDKVRSYNIENVSVIVIYLSEDAKDKSKVADDIKDAVALVKDLPGNAEKPEIKEVKLDKTPVLNFAIRGKKSNVSYRKIREVSEKLEEYLYEINGIADVETYGKQDREYLVEVNPKALSKYRIGLNKVIDTLRGRNIDLPGGSIKVGENEYILRTKGKYNSIEDIKNTSLFANDAGFLTKVKDLAKVSDTFEEADVFERYNGTRSVIMIAWKKRSADEIRVVDTIKEKMKTFSNPYENEITIDHFGDMSRITRDRIDAVIENALVGFLLLIAILFLLMGIRMSLIVTASIPIAFMVAFIGMKLNDITINVISTFGLIMVLGMIVDFSIVVSENSYRYLQAGKSKLDGISKGVSEVFWPVTVTLLCIVAAFAPLLFISGVVGKFIVAIPLVVILCLVASWMGAFLIIPNYLYTFGAKKKSNNINKETSNNEEVYTKGYFRFIQKIYSRALKWMLDYRYIAIVLMFALLIGTLSLSKKVGFVFMPSGGAEAIKIWLKMPQGTNLDTNLGQVKIVEKMINKLPKEELEGYRITVGNEETSWLDPKPGQGTHKSTIHLNLSPEKKRKRKGDEILSQLRKDFDKAKKDKIFSKDDFFQFELEENGPPIGKPINIEIRGESFTELKKIAMEYISFLEKTDGVFGISIDLEEGKQEFRYSINEDMAARTQISTTSAALALNSSFEGAIATSVRDGKDDIDIRVRFPEAERIGVGSLKKVMISNNQGGLIPLSLVTEVKKEKGYSNINRLDYKRVVQVYGNVDLSIITSLEVNEKLMSHFKNIEKRHPGYNVTYGGEQEETQERMTELAVLFLFALFIIFIILAVFMNSIILPVVVMSAIPFATIGVILALLTHGEPMSFMTTLGIFSLAGVIVSNTLVLVQFINYQRDKKLSLKESLLNAGVIRLRPVLLTAGTTVLALIPTTYGFGGKDYFVAPLALAFAYGLIFATFITLGLIPTFYHIAEDLKGIFATLLKKLGIEINPKIYSKKENY
ncbi:MAG: efflux RND transporter permease subunit [Pseudomonadota bacterium]